MKLAAAILLVCLTAGCIRFQWTRDRGLEPLPLDQLETMEAGSVTVRDCLATFGAPLDVWQYRVEGVALAYGYADTRNLGGTVAVPVNQYARPSFTYGDVAARQYGVVFFFDREWRLESFSEGYLHELLERADTRRSTYFLDWEEKREP